MGPRSRLNWQQSVCLRVLCTDLTHFPYFHLSARSLGGVFIKVRPFNGPQLCRMIVMFASSMVLDVMYRISHRGHYVCVSFWCRLIDTNIYRTCVTIHIDRFRLQYFYYHRFHKTSLGNACTNCLIAHRNTHRTPHHTTVQLRSQFLLWDFHSVRWCSISY